MSFADGHRPAQRGFAILIVLWTLVLVALVVTHMIAATREQTELASNLRTGAAAAAAADGAVQGAIFHVLDKSAAHWPPDGAIHRIAAGGAVIDVSIRSESGKVNLNSARVELLSALLRETGTEPARANQIAVNVISWRSPPGQAPATADAYRAAGFAYVPPDAPFESVDELRDVLGVTPEIFNRISPYLTIYHEGDTDFASATGPVLRALQDVYGKFPSGRNAAADESVVDIRAVASLANASQVREAIVRLNPSQNGPLYQVLDWKEGR